MRLAAVLTFLLLLIAALASCAQSTGASVGKIAPAVARALKSNAGRRSVLVVTAPGAAVQGEAAARTRTPRNLPRAVRVTATSAQIAKMAQSEGVIAILPDEPPTRPPVPGPQHRPELVAFSSPQAPLPNTWMATDIVGARSAWQLGYTGRGVKVAVVDDRVDFGHPDLQGTQARVEDPASEHHGWPIIFDPASMEIYAETGRTTSTGYCLTPATITESSPYVGSTRYELPHTSKSGVYRMGAHPHYWLRFTNPSLRSPRVLVADEVAAGVYDTVYVDLDKDNDFTDEKACRRGDEICVHDLNGDGLADLSGGLVYFIADGARHIPASDWLYNLPPPANGSMVCFYGPFEKYESHGTLVASAIAAQGILGAGTTPIAPPGEGLVRGTAPGAKLIGIGNVYASGASMFDAMLFSVLGFDGVPDTGDEADIVNLSFGYSNVDNDGWDALSRYVTYLNATTAPHTAFFASTGNGGPGYGTVTSPGSSPSAISVGASTLYGSVPYLDDIASAEQVVWGDIQPWSNRGPSALGTCEPDVAAIGAWATGATPVLGDGAAAWTVWGGTSLSSPMAAGVGALVFQAYAEARGVRPTYSELRELVQAGSSDLGYPVLEQGAGQVNAAASVLIALGQAAAASPSSWQVGQTAPGFAAVVQAGETVETTFAVTNPTAATVKAAVASEQYRRIAEVTVPVTAVNAEESAGVAPSYLIDLLPLIPEDADLMRVRASIPFDQFTLSDPTDQQPTFNNGFALAIYDWTDLNSNGLLWHDDSPANGVVNTGELDEQELNRYSYDAPVSNSLECSVADPLRRFADGIFLGLQHYRVSPDIPVTNVQLTLEFYAREKWKQVDVSPRALLLRPGRQTQVKARFSTDKDCAAGVYTGAIRLTFSDGRSQLIPIAACVAGSKSRLADGSLAAGSDGQRAPYDNGVINPAFDWGWRPESGDWRFYYYSPTQRPGNAVILANAVWQRPPTDLDLLLYVPDRSDWYSQQLESVFGPYSLSYGGGSYPTNLGGPIWPFATATGREHEWVSAPAREGHSLVMLHSVLDSGVAPAERLLVNAGPVLLEPKEIEAPVGEPFTATLRLTPYLYLWSGIGARAYGFSKPVTFDSVTAQQDPADSPDSAGWFYDLTLSRAGLLEVSTDSTSDIDIDLYVVRDVNGDGYFDWDTGVVALSGGVGAAERISVPMPADGRYRIAVHGYHVSPGATFSIRIDAIQGADLTASVPTGRVLPGKSVEVQLSGTAATPGDAVLMVGPKDAPTAVRVPIHAR